jgi:hypothetical protein
MDREGSFAPSELDCFRVLSHGLRRGLRSFAAPQLGLSSHFSARRFAVRLVARLGFLAGRLLSRPRGRGRLRYTGLVPLRGRRHPRSGVRLGAEFGVFDQVLAGVVGDFAHHRLLAGPVMDVVEGDVFCVPRGDPQGLNDKPGAAWVERAFDQSVDYVHDRKLDGLAVFEQGRGVELHVDALLHAFDHAGVEVRKELTAQGRRSALLSGDFDVGALTNVGMGW